jgi:hypothetical protein
MAEYGQGLPIDVGNLNKLYGFEQPRTNGFLMKNVDGRVPAIKLPVGRFYIDPASVLADDGALPWGIGMWRDIATCATKPGAVHAEKPEKGVFIGVLKFNQGWQAGNPVVPWGAPVYSKGTVINKGPVGYKHAMFAVGQEENYLAYLKGDGSQDVDTVRSTYAMWMEAYKAADDGARLGIFFANDSGFPIVAVVAAGNLADPTLADATFGGFALDEFQPENSAVYFNINNKL